MRAAYYVDRRLGEARAAQYGRLSAVALVAAAAAAAMALAEPLILGLAQDLSDARAQASRAVPAPVAFTPVATATTGAPTVAPPPTQTPPAPPTRAPASPEPGGPRLTFRALASGVDAAGLPVNAAADFDRNVAAIFVFYEFASAPGGTVQHAWFREGGLVYAASEALPSGAFGAARLVWRPGRALQPGRYEVRVSLNDRPAFVANFNVR